MHYNNLKLMLLKEATRTEAAHMEHKGKDPHEQWFLGLKFFVSGDKEQSNIWFSRALESLPPLAEKGDPQACFELGSIYRSGFAVEKDPAKAIYWLTRAAELGEDTAAYSLSVMYRDGEGVDPDAELGLQWLKKSAEMGNELAVRDLRKHKS